MQNDYEKNYNIGDYPMSPLVDSKGGKWGLLLVGASAPEAAPEEAAASGQTKGQVPGNIPEWLDKLWLADPVSDPEEEALSRRYPGRVEARKAEAKKVAPGILHRGKSLLVMSHGGQMWNTPLGVWSDLLGVPEGILATLLEQERLILLGMGCGAPPISDWEKLRKALTKENMVLLAKAREIIPLAKGHAPCFFRVTRDTHAYPGWAGDFDKNNVAALLGVESLPSAHGYQELFKKRVEAILGKAVGDPEKALAEGAKAIKTYIDKMWVEMVEATPDDWANRRWEG